MSNIFKGDIGTKIILDTGIDISTSSVQKIYYYKPDGTTGSWTAQRESDNQSISYTTQTVNDLNVVGTWVIQAYVEISGWKGFGEAVALNIYDNLSAGQSYLTSLASLRRFLGLASTDTTDDDYLNELAIKVSAEIEATCQRTFLLASYTEYHKGNGTSELMVNNFPVTSITSCYDDTDRAWGADTAIPTTDLQISDRIPGLIIYDGGTFFDCESAMKYNVENVKITYVAGYAVIPQDLELAVNMLCTYYYIRSKGSTNSPAGGKDPDKLKEEATDIIEGYKRIR